MVVNCGEWLLCGGRVGFELLIETQETFGCGGNGQPLDLGNRKNVIKLGAGETGYWLRTLAALQRPWA